MNTLPIHVFKSSFGPVLKLLNEHDVRYERRSYRSGTVMASSQVIEIIVNASMWVSLAAVLVAFIKARNGREVIITTKENQIIHAKGLNSEELKLILENAIKISAIDTNKGQDPKNSPP